MFGCIIAGLFFLVVFLAVARFVYPGFPPPRKAGYLQSTYGKWALITGASAGIGQDFATLLAKEQINVVLVARRKDRLDELAKDLTTRFGVETKVIAEDLGTHDGPYNVVKAVKNLDVDIGLFVNNAGFGWFGKFADQQVEAVEQMIQLNVTSVAVLTRLLLTEFKKRNQRSGVIITASLGAFFPGPISSLYVATKAFDQYLSIGCWGEENFIDPQAKNKVDFLSLEPGATKTEFATVAKAATHLVNDASRYTSSEQVASVALDALCDRRPSIIPAHKDYFTSLLAILPRPLATKIIFGVFSKYLENPPH
jgi:short-subunit dehydrogenase